MSVKNFESLKNGKDTEKDKNGFTYFSHLQITEAESASIITIFGNETFTANFGTFNSKELARKKFTELSNSLKECYSNLQFYMTVGDIIPDERYNFAAIAENGFRLYNAAFIIRQYGEQYSVSFEFPGVKKDMFSDKISEMPFNDYVLVTQSKKSDSFSNGLANVMTEAKNAFAKFKDDEIDLGSFVSTFFTSNYQVSGYNNCYIEENLSGRISYVIPYLKEESGESIMDKAKVCMNKLGEALGSEYAYNIAMDGSTINYVKKSDPMTKVLSILLKSNSNNTYGLDIMIYAVK
ncbi:hypothetical protein MASR2M117_03210 [Paludibacter sp.]